MNPGEPIHAECAHSAEVGAGAAHAPERVGWRWIALLGSGHFAVELGCSYVLNRTLDATDLGAGAVLLYNAVAFWGQVPLGWAADRWSGARPLAQLGAALLLAGLLTLGVDAPWATVALIALGNGCYHIGGGVLSIRLSRVRVGGLGLFVGPGALGLTLGVGLARMDFAATPWLLGGLAAALVWPVWRLGGRRAFLQDDPAESGWLPDRGRAQGRTGRAEAATYAQADGGSQRTVLIVALVLACIAIRSFVGTGLSFAWGGSAVAALGIAAALALGKIGGGFLADRVGWLKATIAVLALSVPALWFGQTSMPAGLLGVALFQAPMAVTLGALVWALPGRPGLAFGLASAFVYVGGLPLLAGQIRWLHSFTGLSGLSLVAMVMLAAGLRWRS